MGIVEKVWMSEAADKPDSVPPVQSEGMGQNSSKLLGKVCGRKPKNYNPNCLKGNVTQSRGNECVYRY